MNYVFDVDGTLTPSRSTMDKEFAKFFAEFCKLHNVYLATGSDYSKTVEQVGEEILHSVAACFNCAGNATYIKGQLVKQSTFKISEALRNYLNNILSANAYPIRTGIHIEDRVGLCNFSIVGRGATCEQREDYVKYDRINNDRILIADLLNAHFPEIEAAVAGETGIDIYERGKDKSQIADLVSPFTFFGDTIYPGGNDYTIALRAEKYYNVSSWHHTYELLQEI